VGIHVRRFHAIRTALSKRSSCILSYSTECKINLKKTICWCLGVLSQFFVVACTPHLSWRDGVGEGTKFDTIRWLLQAMLSITVERILPCLSWWQIGVKKVVFDRRHRLEQGEGDIWSQSLLSKRLLILPLRVAFLIYATNRIHKKVRHYSELFLASFAKIFRENLWKYLTQTVGIFKCSQNMFSIRLLSPKSECEEI
jgi:hypothetical protein